MPKDAKFPFQYGNTGDIDTVEGDDFYYYHALQLALIATEDVQAQALTASDKTEIESRISGTIANSPYFESPVSVTTIESDRDVYRAEVSVPNANIGVIEV